MPVLPVIDLLIFLGWTSISIGAVLKAIYLTTNYRPKFVGLGPLDLLLVAGCFLLFALALAARTWVKANEPRMLAARRVAAMREQYPEVVRARAESDAASGSEDEPPNEAVAR